MRGSPGRAIPRPRRVSSRILRSCASRSRTAMTRTELIWEWRLVTGQTVIARLDPVTRVESVWVREHEAGALVREHEGGALVGARLASRSGYGGKPDGHVVPLKAPSIDGNAREPSQDVHVIYDPAACTFVLRSEDRTIAPSCVPT